MAIGGDGGHHLGDDFVCELIAVQPHVVEAHERELLAEVRIDVADERTVWVTDVHLLEERIHAVARFGHQRRMRAY